MLYDSPNKVFQILAEKYRCEIMAEANKQKSMLEANGTAEGIMIKGDADALSVEAQSKAKAEVMAVKADAWRDYQKAAKISMWLDAMPKMAAEVAAPLSQVRKQIVFFTTRKGCTTFQMSEATHTPTTNMMEFNV